MGRLSNTQWIVANGFRYGPTCSSHIAPGDGAGFFRGRGTPLNSSTCFDMLAHQSAKGMNIQPSHPRKTRNPAMLVRQRFPGGTH